MENASGMPPMPQSAIL